MNIVAMCTLSGGLNSIKFALDRGVKIKKVIGLAGAGERDKNLISGVVDIGRFCSLNGLEFDYVRDYSLKDETPEVLGDNVDIIWVCGWQRLLPQAFIDAAKLAVLGVHGSCDGVLKGRGRSPQNWALLIGAKEFEISLFKISAGIDDGDVVDSKRFALNECDTISSSYLKSSMLVAEMIASVYQTPEILLKAQKQIGEAAYFPKRTSEDGAIDWTMSVKDIHNQVRALTDPYPNSFSLFDGGKVMIKQSLPIELMTGYKPGMVVDVLPDNSFLVACRGGLLQVTSYEMEGSGHVMAAGSQFTSVSILKTLDVIFRRFQSEFPGKKINESLLGFWERCGYKVLS